MNLPPPPRQVGPLVCPIPLWSKVPTWAKVWLLVPVSIRAAVYRIAQRWLAKYVVMGITGRRSQRVFKLPFGLYIKLGWFVRPDEAYALHFVREHTNVPSPALLDYIVQKGPEMTYTYLLMTEVPGKLFHEAYDQLSTEQLDAIGLELREHIKELQTIPNPYPKAICGAAGAGIDAPHWTDKFDLPAMDDMVAFHAWIRKMCRGYWPKIQDRLERVFIRFDHTKPVFTHGDLNVHNILIHNGRLSGLIDWETAGWLPLYWEYFAAINWKDSKRPEILAFQRLMQIAIPEDYENERESVLLSRRIACGSIPKEFRTAKSR